MEGVAAADRAEDGSGYQLTLADDERDVDRFEALVARGWARLDEDPAGAAAASREALDAMAVDGRG